MLGLRVVLGAATDLLLQTRRSGCLARSAVPNLLRAAEFVFCGRLVRKPARSRSSAVSVLFVVRGSCDGSGPA